MEMIQIIMSKTEAWNFYTGQSNTDQLVNECLEQVLGIGVDPGVIAYGYVPPGSVTSESSKTIYVELFEDKEK